MQEKNNPEGMEGVARRFVKFGGAISAQQLEWLKSELRGAAGQGQTALVFCHLIIHPDSGPPAALLWNYEEVMAAVKESRCVAAVLSGHAHQVRVCFKYDVMGMMSFLF